MHFEVSVHFYTIHVCYNEIRMLKTVLLLGRDSSVGAATHYRLDGPGIESRWGGARFSAPIQTSPGAHPASFTMGTGSLSPE